MSEATPSCRGSGNFHLETNNISGILQTFTLKHAFLRQLLVTEDRGHTHTLQLQTCPFLRQLPVTGDLGFGETEDLGFGPTEDLGFEATEDLGFGANFSNLNHALSNLNQAPISRPMKPRRSRSHPKLRIVLFKKLRC